MIWTKYLQHALQHMYEVGGDKCDENETLKDDLASAEAKLASKEEELLETHEEVSRARDQEDKKKLTSKPYRWRMKEPVSWNELKLIVSIH